jgi:hypothetical protein
VAGPAGIAQFSGTKFRAYFSNGTLSFWGRVESEGCCDRLEVYVDGNYRLFIDPNGPWANYSVALSAGIHEVEWRYHKDYSPGSGGVDAAWIDDVMFTAQ